MRGVGNIQINDLFLCAKGIQDSHRIETTAIANLRRVLLPRERAIAHLRADGQAMQYGYDAAGNRTSVTYPGTPA